jgi:hypothetical protein
MKKALAGPVKPAAKKQRERRGIVAAVRRRKGAAPGPIVKWTRWVDRRVDGLLRGVEPAVARLGHRGRLEARRWGARLLRLARPLYAGAGRLLLWTGRRIRPVAVLFFRALGLAERRARRLAALAVRGATRASRALPPERALGLVIVASAAFLLASQFVHYRAIEIGRPGYSGLAGVTQAPMIEAETPVDAHSYALVLVAALAAGVGVAAARGGRTRLGRVAFGLGLLSVAVVLLVDMPAGLDSGSQPARFAGATAVLTEGFYAQLAAAAGLMLGGLLLVLAPKAAARYHARPCRTRINLYERAARGLRRRRPRRASSRDRDGRRPSPRRSGAASAPASPP